MPSKDFASLCVLAYKRPEQLVDCLSTMSRNAGYPHEIIINLDADDDQRNIDYLYSQFRHKKLSKLIFTNGKNRGVGRSFANCVGVAEGENIFKIDTDLSFEPNWLKTAVGILDNNKDVGAVSLFNYRNYDPMDERFNVLKEREDCLIVDDFVSSIYGFRRMDLLHVAEMYTDDGFHQDLGKRHGFLAITKKDMVKNSGFGVTKSTYVSGTEDHPFKTKTHDTPLLFGVE